MNEYDRYQAGDIVGVLGGTFAFASEAVFYPPTRLYHFLVLDRHDHLRSDMELHEAIASGVRGGRLSWYQNDVYVVFRPQGAPPEEIEQLGKQVGISASEFGRWGYDYLMYLYLLRDVPRVFLRNLFKEHRARRIRPDELPCYNDHAVICTVLANRLWLEQGGENFAPIPAGVLALPAGYIAALRAGRLKVVGLNIPAARRHELAVLRLIDELDAARIRELDFKFTGRVTEPPLPFKGPVES